MATPEEIFSIRITRRQAVRYGVVGILSTLISAACAPQPLDPVAPDRQNLTEPKKEETETLSSLVTKARKMEDEFKGQNLSDKAIRSQYTSLLADIFTRYYPIETSREELRSSVVFVDSNGTPAFTADRKIYINTTNEVFQKQETAKNPYYPKDWHPLKTLRLALFHEFNHLITQPAEDAAISVVVDPRNDITKKEIDGFAIKGFNVKKELVGLYASIDEASTELLSKYISINLFGSFLSDYSHDNQGRNVTAIMIRLEKLIDSAKIDKMELAYLHRTSNLRGLLLLLTERSGINPQKVSERDRIVFGLSLFEALQQDNQTILQDYMNSAKGFTK